MAKVCIVCQKETKTGYPVKDDFVIESIRKIKNYLRVAKNNELVVMEECLEEHKKKRERYEKNLILHIAIGGILFAVFAILPIFSGSFSIQGLVLGAIFAFFFIALSVFYHWPKLALEPSRAEHPKKAEEEKKQKKKK